MSQAERPEHALSFLGGGGEMGARVRAYDWTKTPLGSPERWPQSLRSAVSMLLPSKAQIILFWGPDFIALYNDAYRPVFGRKHPHVLGLPGRKAWSEVWEGSGLRELLEGVVKTGEAFSASDRLFVVERFGYAEETYFDVSYDPVRDETGGVGGVFCIVTETTARVIGERRLETLGDLGVRTREATESIEAACAAAVRVLAGNRHDLPFALVYLVDGDEKSATLCRSTGIAADSPVAPARIDLLASESAAIWPLAEALRTRRAVSVTDVARRFGDVIAGPWPEPTHSAVVLPIARAGQDQLAGFLVAGISPRRALDQPYRDFLELVAGHIATALANARAYHEERQRAEALAELDRAKTIFFSNVSHEFRTPLTLMLGPLEDALANVHGELPAAASRDLQISHRNALRLLKLVNTLLDFSRIEAGRAQALYEPLDLAAFTAELTSSFRSACDKAGLELHVRCAPLPEPVYVDRDMWEKIVLNLLSNAFKYTLEGEIEVCVEADADRARLVVRDTGIGIPAAELPRMFERFHRVDDSRGRTHEGTGIGLALVHELVKLHGGRVDVESILDEGSRFTVTIPLGTAHLAPERLVHEPWRESTRVGSTAFVEEALRWIDRGGETEEEPRPRPLPRDRPRVVWADDNADMRAYVCRILGADFDVTAVADGEEALAAIGERTPDLVLADVMMPRVDGFGLLRALRADPATIDIPVILLSARAGEEARVEGLQAGADDYVVKPFSARELVGRVRSHIETARGRRAADARRREREAQLASEADALVRLNELSARLWRAKTLHEGVNEIVAAGIELLAADKGNVQLFDAEREVLVIAAQRGFDAQFLADYAEVSTKQATACAVAQRTGERVIVADMEADSAGPLRAVGRAGAFRAVQSTPLVTRDGQLLGVLSTHFVRPHEPDAQSLRRLDLYARQATDFIERLQDEEALRVEELRSRGLAEQMSRLAEERERLLDSERAARVTADRAIRVKDEFLATLSHELRTPINAVLGWAQLGKRGAVKPEDSHQAFEVIERNARIQAQLINDLLDMNRISAGKVRLELELLDPVSVIENAIDAIAPTAKAKGVHIETRFDARGGVVRADPSRLQQVVWNLLANAVKFTDPRGRVAVALARGPAHLELSVADTGAGIQPEFLGHIFERFRQADASTTRRTGGLGLGLAIAKQIVELHGGSIGAASEGVGKGAVFTVRLPLAAPGKQAAATPAPGLQVRSLKGVRILVVDDEPDALELARRLLLEQEADVVTAASASEALHQIEARSPALMISDIGMPEEDGYTLIRRVRALARKDHAMLPAIALTAFARSEDRAQALAAGFQAHVVKPIEAGELCAVVTSVLQSSGAAPRDESRTDDRGAP